MAESSDKKPLKYEFDVIGYVESCFTQKFTIPRQPGLVKQAKATLTLLPEYSHPDIVRGLAQYSHIWVIFVFHESMRSQWKNTVRPPRLGGNERMGVFATRSNFRPNPIGQSVVKLDRVEVLSGKIKLHLSGIDLLDGTPVLDVKPYIPYADAVVGVEAGMANLAPSKLLQVKFSESANQQLMQIEKNTGKQLRELIVEILSYDVRPANYEHNNEKSEFYSQIYGYEMVWRLKDQQILLLSIH